MLEAQHVRRLFVEIDARQRLALLLRGLQQRRARIAADLRAARLGADIGDEGVVAALEGRASPG
ncbi:MAG: hypothetical protein MZV65_10905 [Chromatiales bacterium]|nr:hypothetical protein [Chromatiales bacterium]